MKEKIPKQIGEALAYVQDGIDQLIAFGFEKLKKAGTHKPKKTDSTLKKTALKTAEFLGETGGSFYQKYEEIKEKRRKK